MQAGDFYSDASLARKEISDSGLTVRWVLDVLFERSVEFREALGSGKVKDVRSFSTGLAYRDVNPKK